LEEEQGEVNGKKETETSGWMVLVLAKEIEKDL